MTTHDDDEPRTGPSHLDERGLSDRSAIERRKLHRLVQDFNRGRPVTPEEALEVLQASSNYLKSADAEQRARVENAVARSSGRTLRRQGEPSPPWVPPNDRSSRSVGEATDAEQLQRDMFTLAAAHREEAREVAESLRELDVVVPGIYSAVYENPSMPMVSANELGRQEALRRALADYRIEEMRARFVDGDEERADEIASLRRQLGEYKPVIDPVQYAQQRHGLPPMPEADPAAAADVTPRPEDAMQEPDPQTQAGAETGQPQGPGGADAQSAQQVNGLREDGPDDPPAQRTGATPDPSPPRDGGVVSAKPIPSTPKTADDREAPSGPEQGGGSDEAHERGAPGGAAQALTTPPNPTVPPRSSGPDLRPVDPVRPAPAPQPPPSPPEPPPVSTLRRRTASTDAAVPAPRVVEDLSPPGPSKPPESDTRELLARVQKQRLAAWAAEADSSAEDKDKDPKPQQEEDRPSARSAERAAERVVTALTAVQSPSEQRARSSEGSPLAP